MRRALALVVGCIAASCSSGGEGGNGVTPIADPCTFTNPVAPGQDPWVVRHDGYYHLVESRDGGITVYRSAKLTDLKRDPVQVWEAPDTGWNRSHIWAPELHLIDGRWYIYYAAGRAGPPFVHQRSGVLESQELLESSLAGLAGELSSLRDALASSPNKKLGSSIF